MAQLQVGDKILVNKSVSQGIICEIDRVTNKHAYAGLRCFFRDYDKTDRIMRTATFAESALITPELQSKIDAVRGNS